MFRCITLVWSVLLRCIKQPYKKCLWAYTAVIKIESNKRALLSIKEDREEEPVEQELLVIEEKNDLHILCPEASLERRLQA